MIISPIAIIIQFLWLISALFDYSEFAYRLQLKEYRWDRFKDFLKSKRGEDFIFNYNIFWRFTITLLALLFSFSTVPNLQYAILIILSIDFIFNIIKLVNRKVYRPDFTPRAIALMIISLAVEVSVFLITGSWQAVLFVLMIRFLIISLISALLQIPVNIIKKWYKKKSTEKIKKMDDLLVVGITGSYGKTSVKNYLSKILSCKYDVVKTPENINTAIGVSKFILNHNFTDNEVFVVEMGAYREGEIKDICDIVHPQIGILTGINEEHLSLFGDIKTTQRTKYELLRSIPEDGLVVTNSDNKYCTEYLDELNTTVKTFGIKEDKKPNFLLENIKSKKDKLYFDGKLENKEVKFTASIVGGHNAENLAASILVAKFLNISLDDIKNCLMELDSPDRRLTIREYGRTIIIDDSYNSNPAGFKAALNVLSSYSSDKKHVVITRGMLELGEESDEIHRRIAGEISFYADELVIISKDSEKALKEGILDKYRTNVITKFDTDELLDYVRSLYDSNTVVLVENRLPPKVYKEIKFQEEE